MATALTRRARMVSAWLLGLGALGLVLLAGLPAWMLWALRHPPRLTGGPTPSRFGLDHEPVRLATRDGVELAAWHVRPSEPSRSAVVVAHGYPAGKADVLPATAFLAEDHHLVYLDHRGLGESEGKITLGVDEPQDVLAAVDHAAALDGVEAVGLVGFSMGGAAAIRAAGDERVRAVVAEASYADLTDLASVPFQGLGPLAGPAGGLLVTMGRLAGIDARRARPVEAIADLDVPVLVVHGEKDPTVPVDHARRLADAGENVQAWIVEGAGHGEAALDPAYRERVGAFLDQHLEPGPSSDPDPSPGDGPDPAG